MSSNERVTYKKQKKHHHIIIVMIIQLFLVASIFYNASIFLKVIYGEGVTVVDYTDWDKVFLKENKYLTPAFNTIEEVTKYEYAQYMIKEKDKFIIPVMNLVDWQWIRRGFYTCTIILLIWINIATNGYNRYRRSVWQAENMSISRPNPRTIGIWHPKLSKNIYYGLFTISITLSIYGLHVIKQQYYHKYGIKWEIVFTITQMVIVMIIMILSYLKTFIKFKEEECKWKKKEMITHYRYYKEVSSVIDGIVEVKEDGERQAIKNMLVDYINDSNRVRKTLKKILKYSEDGEKEQKYKEDQLKLREIFSKDEKKHEINFKNEKVIKNIVDYYGEHKKRILVKTD